MKCSHGISNFLEEISSLSHSIVSSISLHSPLRKPFLSLLAILWSSAFKNYWHLLDHRKSKRVTEKQLPLLIMPKPLTVWITTNCGKVLKRWEYQTSWPASWEVRHGKMDWFQIGKGVCQGCILSPCLFNLNAENIMWNARLDEAQAGIKISGRTINNLRHADDTTFKAERE